MQEDSHAVRTPAPLENAYCHRGESRHGYVYPPQGQPEGQLLAFVPLEVGGVGGVGGHVELYFALGV